MASAGPSLRRAAAGQAIQVVYVDDGVGVLSCDASLAPATAWTWLWAAFASADRLARALA